MASYEALGGTGCSIGNLTFTDFEYTNFVGVATGAVPTGVAVVSYSAVPDTGVAVVPMPAANNNGILFSSGGWNAFGGEGAESFVFFTVTASDTVIEDATLLIAGGAIDNATGRVDELLLPIYLLGANVTSPFNHVIFAPISQLITDTDIFVAAAADGLVPSYTTISSVLEEFSTPGVPELGTWAMMIIGFGFVGLRLRRRHHLVSPTA